MSDRQAALQADIEELIEGDDPNDIIGALSTLLAQIIADSHDDVAAVGRRTADLAKEIAEEFLAKEKGLI